MQATQDYFGDDAKRTNGHAMTALDAPAEQQAASGEESPPRRGAVGRFSVWREVLGTWWLGVATVLSVIGFAEVHFGWRIPGVGQLIGERWAWPFLVLVLGCLLAGVLEGSHRAVAKREREAEAQRQEVERLIRRPQRRLVQAKYQLYRDAFMCTQLVGFLMMTKMEASAMTPETALGIERSWGSAFLERFRRMFGPGRFGDVFSNGIGKMFPPPRNQAIAIYVGLADFLRLLAERITESDLDPGYLHGRDEAPGLKPTSGASPDAQPTDPARHGYSANGPERS